jgi:hypothetical protein
LQLPLPRAFFSAFLGVPGASASNEQFFFGATTRGAQTFAEKRQSQAGQSGPWSGTGFGAVKPAQKQSGVKPPHSKIFGVEPPHLYDSHQVQDMS